MRIIHGDEGEMYLVKKAKKPASEVYYLETYDAETQSWVRVGNVRGEPYVFPSCVVDAYQPTNRPAHCYTGRLVPVSGSPEILR